jgi:hypothetical protein
MKLKKRFVRVQKGQPTPGDVHIKSALTNVSVAWIQSQAAYVADKVFPIVNVQHQSDLYYKFNKDDFLRDEAQRRAPASESAGGGYTFTTGTYNCVVEAFHKDIDDQLRSNADSVFQLDRAATEFVTQKLLIRRERRWISSFFTTGVWGTDHTPTNLWDTSSSTPKQDVSAGRMAIQLTSGFKPNTLVMGPQVFEALTYNTDIMNQFKYTSSDSIDTAMMARYFNIDRVLVLDAVYSSQVEGGASAISFMAGKNALLCYSAPSPGVMQPTAGYTFAWTGYTGAVGGWRMKKFRMEPIASDRVEGEMAYDFQVIAPELGYFMPSLVS